MRQLLWVGMLLVGPGALAAPAPSRAAQVQARELAKEADRLYSANKYLEAAQLLKEAYAADPNPILLYNLARAYDQAGELDVAQESYLKFVGLPEAPSEQLKRANLALDRLRGLIARRDADARVSAAERARLTADAQSAQERADLEAQKAREQRAAFEARERDALAQAGQSASGRKVAAFVTGGAAVVATGLWIGFGVASLGSRSAFTRAATVETKKGFEGTTRTQALVADVSLVVAVGAALTAVLLYPKGESPPAGAVSVSVAPAPGGGAFAGLSGSF